MAINITNLIDALNAKVNAIDSSTPLSKLDVLNDIVNIVNETSNIIRYNEPIPSVLNVNVSGDSANSYFGDFAFSNVDQKYYFSFGKSFSESILDDNSAFIQEAVNSGSVAGFFYNGTDTIASPQRATTLYEFPFASDTNVVIGTYGVGAPNSFSYPGLTKQEGGTSLHSATDAYAIGGYAETRASPSFIEPVTNQSFFPSPEPSGLATGGIKFPFASKVVSTVTSSIAPPARVPGSGTPIGTEGAFGNSNKALGYGFISGGNTGGRTITDIIDNVQKFLFTNDGVQQDVSALSVGASYGCSLSAPMVAYQISGHNASPTPPSSYVVANKGQKFPFYSSVNIAVLTDTMVTGRIHAASANNRQIGFMTGGIPHYGSVPAGIRTFNNGSEIFNFASENFSALIPQASYNYFSRGARGTSSEEYAYYGFGRDYVETGLGVNRPTPSPAPFADLLSQVYRIDYASYTPQATWIAPGGGNEKGYTASY